MLATRWDSLACAHICPVADAFKAKCASPKFQGPSVGGCNRREPESLAHVPATQSSTNHMECPICLSNNATYVIQCGSKIKHAICDECEATMRMEVKPSNGGRMLKCPMCRTQETKAGKRSAQSYEYELSKGTEEMKLQVYQERARDQWESIAESIRYLPKEIQEKYSSDFPALRPYLN